MTRFMRKNGDGLAAVAATEPEKAASYEIGEDESGMRLDRWLHRRFPGISNSHLMKIVRQGDTTNAVSVHYQTVDGSAKAGKDYWPTSGIATIPAGAEELLIRAGKVYTMTGAPLAPGAVRVANGKIVEIGPKLEAPSGATVLDLGSGGGIDVLLSARRVGPAGKAYGLDMTDEMLALANENKRKAGTNNVEFLKGEIEHIPLPDNSVDVVISNCVINLSADKDRVLREAFRVLRPGGRFAVSDVVAEGAVPDSLRANMEAWVGCLAGALDVDTYRTLLLEAGFVQVRAQGPLRLYSLKPEPFQELDGWLGGYRQLWEARLDRFGEALKKKQRGELKAAAEPEPQASTPIPTQEP